ncbi:vicilin-like [Neltuma alba]|uniref:vicilin-like n=1 Tax=Neltuma alba TaxID=207710 RepID=UPI0010A4B0EF|nr:vicilin-like [Prosopis alba]
MASLKLPVLLLLGSVFLATVSGLAFGENENTQNQNPYHFRSQNFRTRFQNERGRIRILQRFDQRCDHLQFLRNYRYVELELRPHSLFLPHHRDAEALFVVLEGKAIAGIANQTNRETLRLEEGDVVRVPPGNLVYTANVEEDQRFRVASLILPVNMPGQYENLYPSGNQNPRAYYHAFSQKTLEATFNSNFNEIQRILLGRRQQGGQSEQEQSSSNEGVIVSLSREHARELRRHAESSSSPRRHASSSRPVINLKNIQPRYSNNHGALWEACPDRFQLLRDLDISVALLQLRRGSLYLPHYNSKAIVVAQVIDGTAQLEIASPHLANERSEEEDEENRHEQQQQQQEQQRGEERSEGQIRRVSSRLNQGDAFVALAGHPLALRASNRNDLKVVAFLLNAQNNQRNFLGGERDNVINQIERIVKERTFPGSGEEVERLLRNQKESYFVNAQPRRQPRGEEEEEERAPLSSILEEGSF